MWAKLEEIKMNKVQLKDELMQMNDALNFIDSQFVKLKSTIHTLDQMGFDMGKFYELIDETGIPFSKLKTESRNFIKQIINEYKKEM